jgi:hypothetical protein
MAIPMNSQGIPPLMSTLGRSPSENSYQGLGDLEQERSISDILRIFRLFDLMSDMNRYRRESGERFLSSSFPMLPPNRRRLTVSVSDYYGVCLNCGREDCPGRAFFQIRNFNADFDGDDELEYEYPDNPFPRLPSITITPSLSVDVPHREVLPRSRQENRDIKRKMYRNENSRRRNKTRNVYRQQQPRMNRQKYSGRNK